MDNSAVRVTWLPAEPSLGSISMQRYWFEIDRIARDQTHISVRCPLGAPEFPIRARSRPHRVAKTYLVYPARVNLAFGSEIFHVLDHSFAHLVAHVPPQSRIVVTVHDILPLRESSGLSTAQVGRFRSRLEHLRKADALLAASQFTKTEVVNLLRIEPAKISVNHMGVSSPVAPLRPHDRLARPVESARGRVRILSIGSTLRRKNLEILPQVVAHLRQRGLDAAVVRVGSPLSRCLKRLLERELGDGGLVECGVVSEEVLSWLYGKVDLLLFPSLLEGFGLPVLEAMAHRCPVVCSDASSLPEAAGDAAAYFAPDRPEQASAQIARLMEDSEFRERLRVKGLERARRFTWRRHFEVLAEVYERLAAS